MMMFGAWEWTIIIFIVLILFGAKGIPNLARGISQGINEFREGRKDIHDQITAGVTEQNNGDCYASRRNANEEKHNE